MAEISLPVATPRPSVLAGRLAPGDRTAAAAKEEESGQVSLHGPIVMGLLTLALGVGGFFLWAASTELSSAAIAGGRVIVESSTKTVSHLEGGTLTALAVREGDRVKAGDILATLDATRSRSALSQLRQQLFSLEAQRARLAAERDEREAFIYEARVPEHMDSAAAGAVLLTERRLFVERTSLFRDQLAADRSAIAQLASQRAAIVARRKAWAEQAALVGREFETYGKLHTKRLITTSALYDKKLQLVDLQSRIAESDAALAESNERETQLDLALASRRNDYFRGVSTEIRQIQSAIADTGQQIIAAEDVVAKGVIRAPQQGVVANIRIRTPGSAVPAGSPILDIVPAHQPMLIEGLAEARNIDQMRVGQKTEIKLSAFGAAERRPLVGRLTYIAPDSTIDERTGEVRFVFRATIDPAELRDQPNLFLYPGMAAEIYIVTGDRTALGYLTEPIRRSFSRAFREQ